MTSDDRAVVRGLLAAARAAIDGAGVGEGMRPAAARARAHLVEALSRIAAPEEALELLDEAAGLLDELAVLARTIANVTSAQTRAPITSGRPALQLVRGGS